MAGIFTVLGEFIVQTIIPLIVYLIFIIAVVLFFEKYEDTIAGIIILPFYLIYEYWYIVTLIVGAFFGYRTEKTLYAAIGGGLFFLISAFIIIHLIKYLAKKYL